MIEPTMPGPPSSAARTSENISRFQRVQIAATRGSMPAASSREAIAFGTSFERPRSD
jgi:hypothetical protein